MSSRAGSPPARRRAIRRTCPPRPTYAQGWKIGQPDVVVSHGQSRTTFPPQGEIPYQYFEVATNFTEDKWVQALEIRPGERSVVHHVLVYARCAGDDPPTADLPADGTLRGRCRRP